MVDLAYRHHLNHRHFCHLTIGGKATRSDSEQEAERLREQVHKMQEERQGLGTVETHLPAHVPTTLPSELADRHAKATHRLNMAKGMVQSLRQAHPAQAEEAAACLAWAVAIHARLMRPRPLLGPSTQGHPKLNSAVAKWYTDEATDDIRRIEALVSIIEYRLEEAESARKRSLETVDRVPKLLDAAELLVSQGPHRHGEHDLNGLANELLLLSKRRFREACPSTDPGKPIDWVATQAKLEHAMNEVKLIFYLLNKEVPDV
jgi:hypothetical protein